jgi:hypothetical protein
VARRCLSLFALLLACRQSAGPDEANTSSGSRRGMRFTSAGAGPASTDAKPVLWEAEKRYLFELHSSVMVDFGSSASKVSYDLNGRLDISVLRPGLERTTIYLQLLDPTITSRLPGGQATLDKIAEEIRQSNCTAVFSQGRLLEFGTPQTASASAAASYRQLASALQLAIPTGSKEADVEEYDSTGKYLAHYTFDDDAGTYRKTKQRYISLLGVPVPADEARAFLRPEIVKSVGRIKLESDGQLGSVELHDELVLKGAQMPVQSSNDVVLRRIEVVKEVRSPGELAGLGSSYPILPASESGVKKASIEALDRARMQGASFSQILSRFKSDLDNDASTIPGSGKGRGSGESQQAQEEAAFAEKGKRFDALAAALRSESGAVDQAVAMIKAKSPMTGLLIDGLSSASNARSEEALISLSGSTNEDVKNRALYGLAQMPRPTDKSVSIMRAVLVHDPFNATALYALGAYARRFRDAGKNAEAATLGELLLKRLTQAYGPNHTIVALRAIKNSGYAGALPVLPKYIQSPDKTIREAAMMAFGSIKDPSVDDFLASQLKAAPANTREMLIEAASAREPSAKIAEAITSTFATSDRTARYRGVELLTHWLPQQANLRSFLEKVSVSDPEPRVRDLAKRAL